MTKVVKQLNPFNKPSFWIALIPAFLAIFIIMQMPWVVAGSSMTFEIPWIPSLGVTVSIVIDGLSILFGLIVTVIGTLVILYAGDYLHGHPQLNRFNIFILIFMGSMLGVVFSANLITLFVFWELTSLSSFLLIGFYHEKEASRKAALQALLVTGLGGLFLLVGFLVLGSMGGSFDIANLIDQSNSIQAHPLYALSLILILIGAFTKSAQFPFHFWLPNAMEAPAPVSAYLHSATMVKAGIFLLARLTPVLGGTSLWTGIIVPVGAITMLLAAWMALGQTDLKRILAYSTVSVLGMIVFFLGLGTPLAVKVAIVLLVTHALYKGTLFLAAGSVDHETGSRNILKLGGLRSKMPITALAVGMAVLSQAGLPPLLGFISKELVYEGALASSQPLLWVIVTLLTSAMLVTVAGLVFLRPFFGKPGSYPLQPHEAPLAMWLGPLVLSSLGLFLGLAANWTGSYLIAPAASATLGESLKVKLALWHGLTPMLALSGVTLLLGGLVYTFQDQVRHLFGKLDIGLRLGPARIYDLSLVGLDRYARLQTRFLQNGSLPRYILTVLIAAIGLIGFTYGRNFDLTRILAWPTGISFHEWVLPGLILVATLAIVRARSRLAAVAALGVVGFCVAMLYILFGAPDLAMTQFAIETLTVILFVFVLYRLPKFATYTDQVTRFRDSLVAITGGIMMTVLVLVVTQTSLVSRLTPYFAENSYTLAKGRNIVNVILVDFRGIDTLGEITVLAVAAIGVFALMKLRSEEGQSGDVVSSAHHHGEDSKPESPGR